MRLPRGWRRALGSILLAGLCGLSTGCVSTFNPVEPPIAEQLMSCQVIPPCCKDHVYIFFVNGLDPINATNLTGVRDYLHQLGYQKTYYGQLFHTRTYVDEIRRIHSSDPDARFVLLGFSFGANMVRNIANAVKDDPIQIDLLIYCGGNTLKNVPRDRPANAGRVINVLANGFIWNGDNLENAENIQVNGVWHFGSPAHPYTVQALTREITAVAATVPYREPSWAAIPTAGPNVAETQVTSARDEWDFLKPAPRFGGYQSTESAKPAPPSKPTASSSHVADRR